MQTHAFMNEEARPAVPPKDKDKPLPTPTTADRLGSAPHSSSKRKRYANDDWLHAQDDNIDPHTFKRSRSHPLESEAEASEDSPAPQNRGLRRKKGLKNLREKRRSKKSEPPRDSKFQEGSLTDKPSAKPPSVFTRMTRTESGNLMQVDNLMADYHDGLATSNDSADQAIDRERALMDQRMDAIAAESSKTDDAGGFFRFGRLVPNFAFNPGNLWSKVWSDTKDELTRKNMEDAERKARQKEEAEVRYAQMKQAGQFQLQPVRFMASEDVATPRDSVIIENTSAFAEHKRDMSTGTVLHHSQQEEYTSVSGSDFPDTASKPGRGFKSHFKRPSYTNIKKALKHVQSDFSLAATSRRDSSADLSPLKTDFDGNTLRQSPSKVDLKTQVKLTRRVSDLEFQLQKARRELSNALADASPMPKLNTRYERFKSSSTFSDTFKRPKFVPGKLETLRSQQVLDPAQLGLDENEDDEESHAGGARSRNAIDLSTAFDDSDQEETIKAPRPKQYPQRASTIFNLDNGHIAGGMAADEYEPSADDDEEEYLPVAKDIDMDLADLAGNGVAPKAEQDTDELEPKSVEVDVQAKPRKMSHRSRKRRSGDDEKLFKPTGEVDDDAEWAEANESAKKKRRISGVSKNDDSASTKCTKMSTGAQSSPAAKSSKAVIRKSDNSSPVSKTKANTKIIKEVLVQAELEKDDDVDMADANAEPNDVFDIAPGRTSLDSQGQPLEPLYEEAEETESTSGGVFTVRTNDVHSKPTAKSTPARYGRNFKGGRPGSPNKQQTSVVEATMMSRAAHAAHERRPMSPSEKGEMRKAESAKKQKVKQVFIGQREKFDWPDDVF